MLTSNDYYAASAEQRTQMLADAAQEARDMNNNRPPAVQTHRGKPAPWTMRGYLDAVKQGRTPTHRADGPARIPARLAELRDTNGKTAA